MLPLAATAKVADVVDGEIRRPGHHAVGLPAGSAATLSLRTVAIECDHLGGSDPAAGRSAGATASPRSTQQGVPSSYDVSRAADLPDSDSRKHPAATGLRPLTTVRMPFSAATPPRDVEATTHFYEDLMGRS
jgi:hypothetical protein